MVDVQTLDGTRIRLRGPRLDDADVLFERIASDPEVTRYMSWPTHADVGETRKVITEVFNVGEERTWLIELRGSGEVVGVFGWRPTDGHSINIGYNLARRFWRQGIMSEAVGLVMNDLQRDPAVYRIWAVCHVDNTGSARVLEHAGLALEGRLVRHTVFPNLDPEPQDCLMYGKAVR